MISSKLPIADSSIDRLLDVRQVATTVRVSTRQVLKLVASKRFPDPIKLARSSRWRASDIALFLSCDCDMPRFLAKKVVA